MVVVAVDLGQPEMQKVRSVDHSDAMTWFGSEFQCTKAMSNVRRQTMVIYDECDGSATMIYCRMSRVWSVVVS